jgi:hypothetical protein
MKVRLKNKLNLTWSNPFNFCFVFNPEDKFIFSLNYSAFSSSSWLEAFFLLLLIISLINNSSEGKLFHYKRHIQPISSNIFIRDPLDINIDQYMKNRWENSSFQWSQPHQNILKLEFEKIWLQFLQTSIGQTKKSDILVEGKRLAKA